MKIEQGCAVAPYLIWLKVALLQFFLQQYAVNEILGARIQMVSQSKCKILLSMHCLSFQAELVSHLNPDFLFCRDAI